MHDVHKFPENKYAGTDGSNGAIDIQISHNSNRPHKKTIDSPSPTSHAIPNLQERIQ